MRKKSHAPMSIEGIPSSWSEGPVFEDNDSIWSDVPMPTSDEDTGPSYLKHVVKKAAGAPAEGDESTYSSSLWNDIASPISESRLDSSLLNELEAEANEHQSSMLFEDELRESARRTKITVIEEDAIDEQHRSPSLSFFRTEMVDLDFEIQNVDTDDAYLRMPAEKSMQNAKKLQPTKSVDDSLLDYVITVENENKEKAEEEEEEAAAEDSIFDGVSLLTKDNEFEKLNMESTLKSLFEKSTRALDRALDNIMDNTDFTEEHPVDDSRCGFLAPLAAIAACGEFAHGMCNSDDASFGGTQATQDDTYIDFGALFDSGEGKNTKSSSAVRVDAKDRSALSILDDINEERHPKDSGESGDCGAFDTVCTEAQRKPVVCKTNQERKENIGLLLVESRTGSDILVSKIDSRSKLASTNLKVGMTILSINRQSCPHTVAETLALINATSGDLEIRAVADCTKPSDMSQPKSNNTVELLGEQEEAPVIKADDKTGINETEAKKKGNVSAGADSVSAIGDFLLGLWSGLTSIMKVDNAGEKEEATPGVGEVTENGSMGSGSAADSYAEQRKRAQIFRVQRLNWEEKIGLRLAAGKGGIVVNEIKADSPFRFTGLKAGMRILEINGVLCPGSLVVAMSLLLGSEGDIELLVTNEEKGASVAPVLFYSDY